MSETSDNTKAKLEAARRKAEQLRLMQEEVARELAEAEALESAQSRQQERERAKLETQRLHRASEKQQLRRSRNKPAASDGQGTRDPATANSVAPTANSVAPSAPAVTPAASTVVSQPAEDEHEDWDEDDFEDEDDDAAGTRSSSSKSARKRLGLHCFNCNRYEGHYLAFYRRLWFSFLIGMTFGLAIVIGPYRCQCCGASRLMMSNLLHPKYYIAVSRTRSNKRSRSSRSKSSRR